MEKILSNLFDKAAFFTDIHFGLKQNSHEHNQTCLKFIDWYIEQSKERGVKVGGFLGDWHHIRSNINISTLNYTLQALEKLNNYFEKFYFIIGNHDIYYKDKRDLNGVEFGKLYPNIILIDNIYTEGNVTFLPWLVKEEWKKIRNLKSKYIFGHLELPKFKMNAMVEMPDHGQLKYEDFKNQQYVFSGHFHKRQKKDNIIYIGNPFAHSFSDAWDDERGMMFLEWNKEPEFINFPYGPKYRTMKLSQALSDPSKFIEKNVHARITIDIDINYEEMNYIKEVFISGLKAKEIILLLEKQEDSQNEFVGDVEFKTVDEIVISQLQNIDSSNYDNEMLIDIYKHLDI